MVRSFVRQRCVSTCSNDALTNDFRTTAFPPSLRAHLYALRALHHRGVRLDLQVGPVPVGNNTFEFNADPPSLARLPAADNTTSSLGPPVADLIGVTVLILSALYKDKEFVRVGYYVASNWETSDYGLEVEEGRRTGELDKIVRTVEIGQPRVTRFANSWCVYFRRLYTPLFDKPSHSEI